MRDAATVRWEDLPRDPDDAEDLGYEFMDLDVFRSPDGDDSKVFILPHDEEALREETFMVANVDAVVDLVDRS